MSDMVKYKALFGLFLELTALVFYHVWYSLSKQMINSKYLFGATWVRRNIAKKITVQGEKYCKELKKSTASYLPAWKVLKILVKWRRKKSLKFDIEKKSPFLLEDWHQIEPEGGLTKINIQYYQKVIWDLTVGQQIEVPLKLSVFIEKIRSILKVKVA